MSDNECTNEPDKTPGIISWNEICTRDPEASKKFYTDMFGWESQDMPMPTGSYTMFNTGGRPVAGLVQLPPEAEKAPTAWMGYITVENLTEAVEKARGLGASICKDVTELPMGSFAIVTDPQGATFGLWQFAD